MVTRPLVSNMSEVSATIMQSYRKAVTAARKDKKPDKRQGLTEEQKQEIRCACTTDGTSPPFPSRHPARHSAAAHTLRSSRDTLTLGVCLREAFDLFDTDGSGTIDAKELKVAMRCVHCTVSRILLLTMLQRSTCMPCRSSAQFSP